MVENLVEAIRSHGRSYHPGSAILSFGELLDLDELAGLDVPAVLLKATRLGSLHVDTEPGRLLIAGADDEAVITLFQSPWRTQHIGPDRSGQYHDVRFWPDNGRTAGGTCGSILWASSRALLTWLCSEPGRIDRFVAGRSVLELGSGLGIIGVSLALLGAEQVLCTDLPQQQALLCRNIDANTEALSGGGGGAAASRVRACSFAWGTPDAADVFVRPWDLILGCDVCYDEVVVADLASTLATLLLAEPGEGCARSEALIVAPSRTDFQYLAANPGPSTGLPTSNHSSSQHPSSDHPSSHHPSSDHPSAQQWAPDYQCLLDTLAQAVSPAALHVEVVARLSTADYPDGWPLGDIPPSIDLLVLAAHPCAQAGGGHAEGKGRAGRVAGGAGEGAGQAQGPAQGATASVPVRVEDRRALKAAPLTPVVAVHAAVDESAENMLWLAL